MKKILLFIIIVNSVYLSEILPQQIILTTPNGGESWPAATSQAITWTDNISEYVSIELYKGGSFYYTVADSTPSDAYYTWYIPDTTQDGNDYRIKITSVINSSISDISDADFTIVGNSITVNSPNGGESWQTGSTRAITWTDNINEQVSIDLYKGGSFYYTVVDSTPSDAHHLWEIPDTLQPGSDYRIKITSVDFSSIYDFSDNDFNIYETGITLTTPNGGESWAVDSFFDIMWDATDDIGVTSIDILLSSDGGATYPHTIATGEPNDGICRGAPRYLWAHGM